MSQAIGKPVSTSRRVASVLATAAIAIAIWALVTWRSAPPPQPPLPPEVAAH